VGDRIAAVVVRPVRLDATLIVRARLVLAVFPACTTSAFDGVPMMGGENLSSLEGGNESHCRDPAPGRSPNGLCQPSRVIARRAGAVRYVAGGFLRASAEHLSGCPEWGYRARNVLRP
jgi:hypothetical protein